MKKAALLIAVLSLAMMTLAANQMRVVHGYSHAAAGSSVIDPDTSIM